MPDEAKRKEDDGTSLIIAGALVGVVTGLVLGLAFGSGSGPVDATGLRWLGEGIGDGIAHAACIEARGEWTVAGQCRLKSVEQ